MIYYILTFVMGVAVGALLLIRSYEKDRPVTPRLRCPEALAESESQADEMSVHVTATPADNMQTSPGEQGASNTMRAENVEHLTQVASQSASRQSQPTEASEVATTAYENPEQIEPNLGQYMSQPATAVTGLDRDEEATAHHASTEAGGLIRAAKRVLTEEQNHSVTGRQRFSAQENNSKSDAGDMTQSLDGVSNYESFGDQYSSIGLQEGPVDTAPDDGACEESDQVVTLYLRAPRERPYLGYELLQALLSLGLRIGGRHIFHCFQNMHANKKIMFSVAQSHKPGTFQVERMGGQRFRGLVLFISPELGMYNIISFEQMFQTAKSLQEELGGDLLDHRQRELTFNTLRAIRDRLRLASSDEDIAPVRTQNNYPRQDEHETN